MKNFKNVIGQTIWPGIVGGALLLALPMCLTSCEDILGHWERPASADAAAGEKYYSYNADGTKTEMTIPSDAILWTGAVAAGDVAPGTYVVEGNATCDGNLSLKGQVNLILKDGAKLTVSGGIGSGSLDIYGQSDDEAEMGQLIVNNSTTYGYAFYVAGLNVHGGKIIASGDAAGIHCHNGDMNVYGGVIEATGVKEQGINVGSDTPRKLTIYGGKVTATGGSKSTGGSYAGITCYCSNGAPYNRFIINGGTVVARGGNCETNNGGKGIEIQSYIEMNGGEVTCFGGNSTSATGGNGADYIWFTDGTFIGIGGDGSTKGIGCPEIANKNGDAIHVDGNTDGSTTTFGTSGTLSGNVTETNTYRGIKVYK